MSRRTEVKKRKKARKRKQTARNAEKTRSWREMLGEDDQVRMVMLPSVPFTAMRPDDERLLRAAFHVWESEWRRCSPKSQRMALASLDTEGDVTFRLSENGPAITAPTHILHGVATGMRTKRCADGLVPQLKLACVYGIADGTWRFVDDHVWLDASKCFRGDSPTTVRCMDTLVLSVTVSAYNHEDGKRYGIDRWRVLDSGLLYTRKGRRGTKRCPSMCNGEFDMLQVSQEGTRWATEAEMADMKASLLRTADEFRIR